MRENGDACVPIRICVLAAFSCAGLSAELDVEPRTEDRLRDLVRASGLFRFVLGPQPREREG